MNPSTLSNIIYYSFNLLFEYIFVTLYEDTKGVMIHSNIMGILVS